MAAAAECDQERSPMDYFNDTSDMSVPMRDWTSVAGSAYEEPVMAVTERTRTCFLCFSPDHYILGCPQLKPNQKAMAHQKRLALSQIEKPFGPEDVPYWLNKPAGQSYRQTQQLVENPNGHGNEHLGQPTGKVDRPYGQPHGYSRPLASNRAFSEARLFFVEQCGWFPLGVVNGATGSPMGRPCTTSMLQYKRIVLIFPLNGRVLNEPIAPSKL
jgi:hypothetical protein